MEQQMNKIGLLFSILIITTLACSISSTVAVVTAENSTPTYYPTATVENTLQKSYVVVNCEYLHLREHPNDESNILDDIPLGEKLKVISYNGDWYNVEYNNKIGYVFHIYVKEQK